MVVLNVRNERWDGVPFILKAGKALDERRSEIRVQLKSTPGDIFAEDDGLSRGRRGAEPADLGAGPNEFVLRIQPHEEMYMKLTIKEPGLGVRPVPSEMELSSRWREEQERKEVAGEAPRRAYERLILDAVNGHQAHFVRGDELEAAWAIVDPINAAIESGEVPVHEYTRGTRGPKEADALRKSVGHVTCPVPRDGALLSSSDDLCAEAPVGNERAETGLGDVAPVRARGSDDAASEDDGTPKHERRRSGVPASVVWGKEGEETTTPMPPEA
jgi:glucose-6-phosphate 1-dehydrogenase